MNCCTTDDTVGATRSAANEAVCTGDELPEAGWCESCKKKGRPVSTKTVLLMLKPDFVERAMHGSYSFCSEGDCSIVYFEDTGNQQFTVDDLRVRVGLKVDDDPIPLCYCFGFDEKHIRDEIEQSGNTSVPAKVSRLIRKGLCACESRNPSGACCLGEVKQAMKRIIGKR
jgi:Zinc binding domain